MSDSVNQVIDAFLGRHLTHVEFETKDNASTAMHTPEEHTNLLFWRTSKTTIPQDELPVEGPTFNPEGCGEEAPVGSVPSDHMHL
jgi:hypothetical protein